jgi:hypothetical protein
MNPIICPASGLLKEKYRFYPEIGEGSDWKVYVSFKFYLTPNPLSSLERGK